MTEAFPGATAIDDGQFVLSYRDLLTAGTAKPSLAGLASSSVYSAGDQDRYPHHARRSSFVLLAHPPVLSIGAAYVRVDIDDPDDRAELPGPRQASAPSSTTTAS